MAATAIRRSINARYDHAARMTRGRDRRTINTRKIHPLGPLRRISAVSETRGSSSQSKIFTNSQVSDVRESFLHRIQQRAEDGQRNVTLSRLPLVQKIFCCCRGFYIRCRRDCAVVNLPTIHPSIRPPFQQAKQPAGQLANQPSNNPELVTRLFSLL